MEGEPLANSLPQAVEANILKLRGRYRQNFGVHRAILWFSAG